MGALIMTSIEYTLKKFRLSREVNRLGPSAFALTIHQFANLYLILYQFTHDLDNAFEV